MSPAGPHSIATVILAAGTAPTVTKTWMFFAPLPSGTEAVAPLRRPGVPPPLGKQFLAPLRMGR